METHSWMLVVEERVWPEKNTEREAHDLCRECRSELSCPAAQWEVLCGERAGTQGGCEECRRGLRDDQGWLEAPLSPPPLPPHQNNCHLDICIILSPPQPPICVRTEREGTLLSWETNQIVWVQMWSIEPWDQVSLILPLGGRGGGWHKSKHKDLSSNPQHLSGYLRAYNPYAEEDGGDRLIDGVPSFQHIPDSMRDSVSRE